MRHAAVLLHILDYLATLRARQDPSLDSEHPLPSPSAFALRLTNPVSRSDKPKKLLKLAWLYRSTCRETWR